MTQPTVEYKDPALVSPKIVILFGAGASAFSGPTKYCGRINKNTPLGSGPNGLFNALRGESGIAMHFPDEIQRALIKDFEAGMCPIPDDCIDYKRYPLFMARSVMRELIEQFKAQPQGVRLP